MTTKKLKVYGGRDARADRMIVAASSWAEVQRITGRSMYELRNFWSISGNPDDIMKAMATPGVPVLIPDPFRSITRCYAKAGPLGGFPGGPVV